MSIAFELNVNLNFEGNADFEFLQQNLKSTMEGPKATRHDLFLDLVFKPTNSVS